MRVLVRFIPCLLLGLIAFPAHAAPQEGPVIKIILDTDIGDDIDDAYAVALLCSQPNVRLLGVTTAFGQTHERARVAAKLLRAFGHGSVPVFAGRPGAAKIGRQYEWARDFASPAIKAEPVVEFMRRALEADPGEIEMVAIGALTNLGDLLTRYPDVKSKIKRIVIMGGAVHVGYNNRAPATVEWNIKCDPVAARAVFDSGVHVIMAGLEVTTMMQLDAERQRRIFAYGTPGTDALAALTSLWGNGTPTLFDPVAAAYAMGHTFADEETATIAVTDEGLTQLARTGYGNVTVLIHPRKETFLDWYVGALKPRSAAR